MKRFLLTTPWYGDGVYYAADALNPIVLEVPDDFPPARFWRPTKEPATHVLGTAPSDEVPDDAKTLAEMNTTADRPKTGILAEDKKPAPRGRPPKVKDGAKEDVSDFDQ